MDGAIEWLVQSAIVCAPGFVALVIACLTDMKDSF